MKSFAIIGKNYNLLTIVAQYRSPGCASMIRNKQFLKVFKKKNLEAATQRCSSGKVFTGKHPCFAILLKSHFGTVVLL